MAKNNWTYEKLKAEALKYHSKKEFEKNSSGAYQAAHRLGIVVDICSHMISKRIYWTDMMLAKVALNYNTRAEFQHNDVNAYITAQTRGILDNICQHMVTMRYSWTHDMLQKEASKYSTRNSFKINSNAAYSYAMRHKLLDNICSHMTRPRNCGFNPEKPGTLYYIKFISDREIPLYKIGITNGLVKNRILGMNINKNVTFTILQEFYFDDGKVARAMEKSYHLEFKEHQYTGQPIMRCGNTELFVIDVLGLDG